MSHGIPASFQLAGHTVQVRIIPASRWTHGDRCEGVWIPNKHLIEISAECKGTHRQAVFTHELMHAMLDAAGYEKLSRDEEHVERMGQLLMQVLTTFEARKARKRARKEG